LGTLATAKSVNPQYGVFEPELEWLSVNAKGKKFIYELGSYLGRSTLALASSGSLVYAVDNFRGNHDMIMTDTERDTIYKRFLTNTAGYKNIIPLVTDHDKFVPVKECDMVFIDGSHDYPSVKRDINKFLNHKNILICGHDYTFWQGVKEAVDEIFGKEVKRGPVSIWYVIR